MHPTAYFKNVFWLPSPNRLELCFGEAGWDSQKVAAAFCFVFTSDNKLILVEEKNGRLDLPGGGREPNETAEETAVREVLEEVNVKVKNVRPIGWHKVHVDAEAPAKNRRPWPDFYEVFFVGEAEELLDGPFKHETAGRVLLSLEEAAAAEPIQYQYNRFLFEQALKKAGRG